MKNTLLLLAFIGCSFAALPQQRQAASKLDARLKMWVAQPSALIRDQPGLFKNGPVNDVMISLLFKTTSPGPGQLVSAFGGRLYSHIGNICTAEIPLKQVEAFASQPEVIRLEASQPVEIYNDQAIRHIRADSVHQGLLPEGVSYSGKTVLVGIVDTGIDFLHPDFRERTDSTRSRILAIWDQTDNSGTPPAGFAYGSAWDAAQVQAALANPSLITQHDSSGHGTHVAGSAAGLRGMAYDADIISVKTPLVSNGDYRFSTSAKTLDAVKYIYDLAGQMQRACVVNMSIGFNFGAPHDGTSLFEQGLDALTASRSGFVVCVSAGNEGRDFSHHGDYTVPADSVWTYINALNGCTWYGVNNTSANDSLHISVIMDSTRVSFGGQGIVYQKPVFQSPWMNINAIKASLQPIEYAVLYGNGDTASIVTITAAAYDASRTEWYVYTRDRNSVSTDAGQVTANIFKIAFKGGGRFHAWIQALNNLGVNISSFNGATNARFRASDNKYVIGIPGTAKSVITVGAYINKKDYVNLYGNTALGLNSNSAQAGGLAFFSSNGPTVDGRMKPDISAPGLNVASSWSRHSAKDSARMTDGQTIVFSGTSMSSPVTAGAVALLLEKFKFASNAEVKSALTASAHKDNFMVGLPNNIWGYGKLNIFAAMKLTVTGLNEAYSEDGHDAAVYPNPASSTVWFRLPAAAQTGELTITDLSGKACYTTHDPKLPVDVSGWKNGLYLYTIRTASNVLHGKFIVQ